MTVTTYLSSNLITLLCSVQAQVSLVTEYCPESKTKECANFKFKVKTKSSVK